MGVLDGLGPCRAGKAPNRCSFGKCVTRPHQVEHMLLTPRANLEELDEPRSHDENSGTVLTLPEDHRPGRILLNAGHPQ